MTQIGRFTVLSGWEKSHSPIIGEVFNEIQGAELLNKDTIYSIQETGGVLTLVELGPSALESYPGGKHYGWTIEDILTGTDGAYVQTRQELESHKE